VSERIVVLSLPSAVVLALLVAHSLRSLTCRRALIFWGAVISFGAIRGLGVRAVAAAALGGNVPYRLLEPAAGIAGVALQEIAGWCVVAYLAWWCGARLSRNVPGQTLWAAIVLAAASWSVEVTAVAAGWWSWSLSADPRLFFVPGIALVDWAFVAPDFLLPFLLMTTPAPVPRIWRVAPLAIFPLHMAAHTLPLPVWYGVPFSPHEIWHWLVPAALLGLALRFPIPDAPFPKRRTDPLPILAMGVILLDLGLVQIVAIGKATLLVALAPLAGLALAARYLAINPAPRRSATMAWSVALAILLVGLAVLTASARRAERYRNELSEALRARDGGRLDEAVRRLEALRRDHPSAHAARGFLGEIHYRTGDWQRAEDVLAESVRIKPDFVFALRYLTVMALRSGDPDTAATLAATGLSRVPADQELQYLGLRARGEPPGPLAGAVAETGPEAALALAGLAFEVGDPAGARRFLEAGVRRWPDHTGLAAALRKIH